MIKFSAWTDLCLPALAPEQCSIARLNARKASDETFIIILCAKHIVDHEMWRAVHLLTAHTFLLQLECKVEIPKLKHLRSKRIQPISELLSEFSQ